eukprot:TRINITY_DN2795_c0_g1_i1.p1 TRINITY_DN2795_c0_g1~~TRINITY_DN2795_c0_g1_i1.p1  ORF type:complete len:482 (+),score=107.41 TRINITY_DN2795_c0_g1_i1:65-1510(+)
MARKKGSRKNVETFDDPKEQNQNNSTSLVTDDEARFQRELEMALRLSKEEEDKKKGNDSESVEPEPLDPRANRTLNITQITQEPQFEEVGKRGKKSKKKTGEDDQSDYLPSDYSAASQPMSLAQRLANNVTTSTPEGDIKRRELKLADFFTSDSPAVNTTPKTTTKAPPSTGPLNYSAILAQRTPSLTPTSSTSSSPAPAVKSSQDNAPLFPLGPPIGNPSTKPSPAPSLNYAQLARQAAAKLEEERQQAQQTQQTQQQTQYTQRKEIPSSTTPSSGSQSVESPSTPESYDEEEPFEDFHSQADSLVRSESPLDVKKRVISPPIPSANPLSDAFSAPTSNGSSSYSLFSPQGGSGIFSPVISQPASHTPTQKPAQNPGLSYSVNNGESWTQWSASPTAPTSTPPPSVPPPSVPPPSVVPSKPSQTPRSEFAYQPHINPRKIAPYTPFLNPSILRSCNVNHDISLYSDPAQVALLVKHLVES